MLTFALFNVAINVAFSWGTLLVLFNSVSLSPKAVFLPIQIPVVELPQDVDRPKILRGGHDTTPIRNMAFNPETGESHYSISLREAARKTAQSVAEISRCVDTGKAVGGWLFISI